MPTNETITIFGDRLIALAERTITQGGGVKVVRDGKQYYRIQTEPPANIRPLPDAAVQFARLQNTLKPEIEQALRPISTPQQKARAAYQAICLEVAPELSAAHPAEWAKAIEALKAHPRIVSAMFFEADTPAGEKLRQRAFAAGLEKPEKKVKLW